MPRPQTPRGRRRDWLALLGTLVVACSASVLLVHSAPAWSQRDPAFESAFIVAAERLQQASAGERAAVDDAAERFGQLLAQHPADPLLRAYTGAATALRATTTLLPWRKLGLAEDGLALIDQALAQLAPAHAALQLRGVPVALETRFVAANTFLNLPTLFNRNERGRKLLDEVLASPAFADAAPGFRASVWLRAGKQAEADQQREQARHWYTLVVASKAPQAAMAARRLEAL